jgi:hypothetical protein
MSRITFKVQKSEDFNQIIVAEINIIVLGSYESVLCLNFIDY